MKKAQKKTSKSKRIAHIGMGAVMALPTIVAVVPTAVQAAEGIEKGGTVVATSAEDAIVVGDYAMGVVTPEGGVSFWGYPGQGGNFGDSKNAYSEYKSPRLTGGVDNVDKVYMTTTSSFIVKKDGTVWASGSGGYNTLPARSNSFVQLMSLKDEFIVKMDATTFGVVALNSKGEVFYWGGTSISGDGSTSTPRKIPGLVNVKDVEITDNSIAVVLEDDSLGYYRKTLDTGSSTSYSYENSKIQKFTGANNIKAIDFSSSGEGLALKLDGTVMRANTGTREFKYLSSELKDIVAIARGFDFDLALNSNGDVYAWGENSSGQLGINPSLRSRVYSPEKISGLSNIKSIKANYKLALAVDKDGVAHTWGVADFVSSLGRNGDNFAPSPVNNYDVVVPPKPVEKPVVNRIKIQDMKAKTKYLSRKNNTIRVNVEGKLTGTYLDEIYWVSGKVTGATNDESLYFTSAGAENELSYSVDVPATAGEHSINIKLSKSKGGAGELLGEGTVKINITEEEIEELKNIETEVPTRDLGNVLVSTDNKHTVSGDGGAMGVVTADGGVSFWGVQGLGNFGRGTTMSVNEYPKITPGVKDVDKIFMVNTTTYLLKKDSSVWVAGNPSDKTFSASEPYLEFKEVKELSNIGIDKIATSIYGQVALSKKGEVFFWGGREKEDVGASATPRKLKGVTGVKDVVVDENMIALLFDNGTVGIVKKTLDNGSTISNSYTNSPVTMLDDLTNIKSLGTGSFAESFFGIKEDGTVVEYNYYKSVLKTIPNLTDIVSISTGFNFSTALDSKGNVYAWGSNEYGQMGQGYKSYDRQEEPIKIDKLSDISSISSRYLSAVAVDKEGVAYTWGKQELFYALGRDGAQSVPYPVTKYVPAEPEVPVTSSVELKSAKAGDVYLDTWDNTLRVDLSGVVKGDKQGEFIDIRNSIDGTEQDRYYTTKVPENDTKEGNFKYSTILPNEIGTYEIDVWAKNKSGDISNKITLEVDITQEILDKLSNTGPEVIALRQNSDTKDKDGSYVVTIAGAVKDKQVGDVISFKYRTMGEDYVVDKTVISTGDYVNFEFELSLPFTSETPDDSRWIYFYAEDDKGAQSIKQFLDISAPPPPKANTKPEVIDWTDTNKLYSYGGEVTVPVSIGVNDADWDDTVTIMYSVDGEGEYIMEDNILPRHQFPSFTKNIGIGKEFGTHIIEVWAVDNHGEKSDSLQIPVEITQDLLLDLGLWQKPTLTVKTGTVEEKDGSYTLPVSGKVKDLIKGESMDIKYSIQGVENTLVSSLISTGYNQSYEGTIKLPEPSALDESLNKYEFGENPPTVDITFWAEDETGLSSEKIIKTATYPVKPQPVEPEKPTEPVIPVEPEKPTEPVIPVEPEKPTEPVIPVEPEKPTEPVIPVEPEKPTEPEVKPTEPEVKPTPNPSTGGAITPPYSDTISGDLAQDLGYVLLSDKTKTNDIVIELLRDSLQDSSEINMNVHIKPDKDIIEPTLYMYYTHKTGASKDKFKIDDLDVFETVPLKTIKAGGGIDVKVSSSLKKGKDYKVSAVLVDKGGKVHSKNELDSNKLKEYMVLKKVNQDVESKGLLSKLTSAVKGVFSGK